MKVIIRVFTSETRGTCLVPNIMRIDAHNITSVRTTSGRKRYLIVTVFPATMKSLRPSGVGIRYFFCIGFSQGPVGHRLSHCCCKRTQCSDGGEEWTRYSQNSFCTAVVKCMRTYIIYIYILYMYHLVIIPNR